MIQKKTLKSISEKPVKAGRRSPFATAGHVLGALSYLFGAFGYAMAAVALLYGVALLTGGAVLPPPVAPEAPVTQGVIPTTGTVIAAYVVGVVCLVAVIAGLYWALKKTLQFISRLVHALVRRAAAQPTLGTALLVKAGLYTLPMALVVVLVLVSGGGLMGAFLIWVTSLAALAIVLAGLQVLVWRLARLKLQNLL